MQFMQGDWLLLTIARRAQVIDLRNKVADTAKQLGRHGVPFAELDKQYAALKELLKEQQKLDVICAAEIKANYQEPIPTENIRTDPFFKVNSLMNASNLGDQNEEKGSS